MAKLSSNMAEKLKNMSRKLQEENSANGVRGVADQIKRQAQSHKKQISGEGKASGRKD